jgi:hypothetical protein
MAFNQSLSKLKESQQVARWQDRLAISRKFLDTTSEQNNWRTYQEELKGKYDVVLGNIQVPPINEIFAYRDASVANLYYRDPFIAINPKKDATIAGAYILEAGVNHLWKELKLKEDVELEISDTILVGHSWNKVGNNTKTAGSGNNLQIVEDSIYANRVSWQDMLMNVGCKRPTRDNIWVSQRIYKPTTQLKDQYGSRAAKINGSPYPSIDAKNMKNVLYKEDFNYSAIYEVWSVEDRMIYTLCDEMMDKYLEDPKPWPEWLSELPYQFLSFHDIPDEPYPQSDIAAWEPQVKEKIKLFTMMLNFAKRWNRQALIKKGTMGLQELDKFEKGIEGSILQAATTGDIQQAIKMLDWGSMPPDFFMLLDRLDALIDRIRGQSQFMQGGVTKTATRTEGELQLIKSGADARTDRKQNRIENHCENIARHLVMQMKANFDVPYVAKITGKEPEEILAAFKDQGKFDSASKTITFNKEDIKGEYDVSIKMGSTLPLNKANRDRILSEVFSMAVPLASAPSVPPFMAEVIKEILKDHEIKGLEVAFDQQQQAIAQQDVARQQEAAIESGKVQAETAKRNAQAQQIQVDTLIKGVQATGKATGQLSPEESLTK